MPLSCGLLPQRPRPYGPASQIGFQLFNDPQPRTSRPGIFLDLLARGDDGFFRQNFDLRLMAADTDRERRRAGAALCRVLKHVFDDAVFQ